MTDREKLIADSYKRTRSYSETARKIGISRQGVAWVVLRLRARGETLPEPKRQRQTTKHE